MTEQKKCEECKFFVGEMLRAVGPNTGYCDNEKSPYYKKKVNSEDSACEDYE